MKVSKKELIRMGASKECLERFIRQTNNTDEKVCVSSLIGGANTTADLFWLAGEKLDKEYVARFHCDRALINILKIKNYCSDDDLKVVVGYLKNPTTYSSHAGSVSYILYTAGEAAYNADDRDAVLAADIAYDIIYAVRSDYETARVKAYQVREAYNSVWNTLDADANVKDLLFKMCKGEL